MFKKKKEFYDANLFRSEGKTASVKLLCHI